MAVKLLVLKSYEDVIADVKEAMSGERVIGYSLSNPFITRINDEGSGNATSVTFYPYIPLSKQKDILIPFDWVVTMVDPHDEVANSYLEHVNGQTAGADKQSNSDQQD